MSGLAAGFEMRGWGCRQSGLGHILWQLWIYGAAELPHAICCGCSLSCAAAMRAHCTHDPAVGGCAVHELATHACGCMLLCTSDHTCGGAALIEHSTEIADCPILAMQPFPWQAAVRRSTAAAMAASYPAQSAGYSVIYAGNMLGRPRLTAWPWPPTGLVGGLTPD